VTRFPDNDITKFWAQQRQIFLYSQFKEIPKNREAQKVHKNVHHPPFALALLNALFYH